MGQRDTSVNKDAGVAFHVKLSGGGAYPSPAPQTQNKGQQERLPSGEGSEVGRGLKSIFITSTDFADKTTAGEKRSGLLLCSSMSHHNLSVRVRVQW